MGLNGPNSALYRQFYFLRPQSPHKDPQTTVFVTGTWSTSLSESKDGQASRAENYSSGCAFEMANTKVSRKHEMGDLYYKRGRRG